MVLTDFQGLLCTIFVSRTCDYIYFLVKTSQLQYLKLCLQTVKLLHDHTQNCKIYVQQELNP